MDNLIHATCKENLIAIQKEGFKIFESEYPPRFGHGIYFMTSEEYGYADENKSRVYCSINDKHILHLTHDEVRLMYPELEIEYQEGGAPILKEYVLDKGYNAVEISYIDGTSEIVVYDTSIISYEEFDFRKA